MQKLNLLENASTCNEVYKIYKNILNTYVSDFYIENHWALLLNSWKEYFGKLTLEELSSFLKGKSSGIAPLSIICLQKIIASNVFPRQSIVQEHTEHNLEFMKEFSRGVKLKKRHEISVMANICYELALKTNCFYVVDIGSGLGHLSRMLSYGYGFKVCTFEANTTLSNLAGSLDRKFEKMLTSNSIVHKKTFSTIHINTRIEENIPASEFSNLISKSFGVDNSNFKFGIVGLHTCGDLGVTLLRLFMSDPNVSFINIVGCCYMKLTREPSLFQGFPLSNFCKLNKFTLDYLSCELACHALEVYVDRLLSYDTSHLKVHAFRAGLESILVKIDPKLKHSQIANVKSDGLTFLDYCKEATKNMVNIKLDLANIEYFDNVIDKTWLNIVKFYSLRLAMAPIIESIILYDRWLFVNESGNIDCNITPVFDCKVSPRNHVLSATKC